MMNVVKYGTLATLAALGSLAAPALGLGVVGNALISGGLVLAEKGIEKMYETPSEKTAPSNTVASVLKKSQRPDSINEIRERSKKGRTPAYPRDKRIAGR
ncbi:MAG: hypothetical protein IKV03_02920 [Alphaproteobacteria bacterium]|nr:hypothetical protein [Alphaproteobacteria bacterium]